MCRNSTQMLILLVAFCTITMSGDLQAQQCCGYYGGLDAGYTGGAGAALNGTLILSPQSKLSGVRLALGYASVNGGRAEDARRVFINDATNGIPESHGRWWDVRLDLLWPMNRSRSTQTNFVTGLRHVSFTGNFKYVGGNEDFDVTSSQWGVGAGVEHRISLNPMLGLVLGAGIDYFFNNTLYGHDTSYSPSGANDNPRNDYTWSDADAAIDQPRWEPRLTIGFSYLISR